MAAFADLPDGAGEPTTTSSTRNLIALGDFNIDRRNDPNGRPSPTGPYPALRAIGCAEDDLRQPRTQLLRPDRLVHEGDREALTLTTPTRPATSPGPITCFRTWPTRRSRGGSQIITHSGRSSRVRTELRHLRAAGRTPKRSQHRHSARDTCHEERKPDPRHSLLGCHGTVGRTRALVATNLVFEHGHGFSLASGDVSRSSLGRPYRVRKCRPAHIRRDVCHRSGFTRRSADWRARRRPPACAVPTSRWQRAQPRPAKTEHAQSAGLNPAVTVAGLAEAAVGREHGAADRDARRRRRSAAPCS